MQDNQNECVLSLGWRHSVDPAISTYKHSKKCVFGVFLFLTRIALVCENLVINIALESGARGRNRTTDIKIMML
jgi:hypothetical protein